ncbi:MAG: hypothetical protein GXX96_32530 [Planctomycetaceae bacterium]|nr:hypothetical protein [Planctomycetaceae bacterium]
MKIEVVCQCGRRYAAQQHLAGQEVPCPFCGATMVIPKVESAQPKASQVRCPYCHEYVPQSQYGRHEQQHLRLQEDGQQAEYATLPPEEREVSTDLTSAPRWYRHKKCGQVTGMPEEIIQTYLTNPWFYLSDKTFCTGCGKHVRLRECVWEETGENLQTYNDRLRAGKPGLRPGLPKLLLAWIVNTFF